MPVADNKSRRHLSFMTDELYAFYEQMLNEGFEIRELSKFLSRCGREHCNMRNGVAQLDRPLSRPSKDVCKRIDELLTR